MAQSIPINPRFGQADPPWAEGGHRRGPIMTPPAIGDIGPVRSEKLASRNRAGNQIMRVGKK